MSSLALPIDFKRDHVLGPPEAPITLLEYGDYECPDCGRAYPLLKQLQGTFGEQLAFIFRHFPQYTIHRHASVAAQAAEAAAAQGHFWKMHDLLYSDQANLEMQNLTHHALKLGLDPYKFDAALGDGSFERRVEEDYLSGKNSGVRGTPTLFINGTKYDGELELGRLSAALEAVLKGSRS